MLSVQSVNLMRQPAFGVRQNVGEYVDYEEMPYSSNDNIDEYTKSQYTDDKTKLEKQLDEINAVIENTDVPKPVRAIGKVASVGIGAGLGFVSMKYGAQGMAKIIKKGASYAKSLTQKPLVQAVANKSGEAAEAVKSAAGKVINKARDSKAAQDTSSFFNDLVGKYKNSKFGIKVAGITSKITDNKPAKYIAAKTEKTRKVISEAASNVYNKVIGITGEKVEKGIVNLFAVSGGVTGGITALQEVTADK